MPLPIGWTLAVLAMSLFGSLGAWQRLLHSIGRPQLLREDGSLLGAFETIYIVTLQNGHWGIQARSSFAD